MTDLLASRWTVALAEALVTLLGQGVLVAVLHEVARLVVGPGRPRARYALASVALFALPACLVATWWSIVSAPVPRGVAAPASAGLASWVVLAWWLGATATLLRLAGAWLRLRRVVAHASDAVDRAWLEARDRLAPLAGVAGGVAIKAWAGADVPMVVGVLRPVVLLPLALATGASPGCVDAVLAHELMHLRRHDYLVNLLQSVVEALLFYHPAVWWLSHRMRVEREYCCDDGAALLLDDRLGYARALVELERLRGAPPALALGASGGPLKKRVMRMIDRRGSTPRPGFAAVGALAVLVVVAAGLATGAAAQAAEAALSARWMPPSVARHADAIVRASERNGVDADLLAAMLLIESGGDEAARSPSGAAGLMQLMPETARRIAKARGLDAPTDEAIFDPELNLDFGAWYLARQLERFEDPRLAVAAYNAGPARVVAHVERGQRLPDESRRYADQVIALWSERSEATSPTLTGLFERTRAQLRGRMKAPVDLSAVRLGFGENAHPIRKVPFEHQGIDVPQAEGTSVQAALRGVVRSVDAKGTADARGRYIVLQHGRLETRYYHLAAVRVAVGQQVEAGEVIGEVGNSGVSTGPHLHFEVREMGTPVDPGLYYDLGR